MCHKNRKCEKQVKHVRTVKSRSATVNAKACLPPLVARRENAQCMDCGKYISSDVLDRALLPASRTISMSFSNSVMSFCGKFLKGKGDVCFHLWTDYRANLFGMEFKIASWLNSITNWDNISKINVDFFLICWKSSSYEVWLVY